jgi:hypothetical protein
MHDLGLLMTSTLIVCFISYKKWVHSEKCLFKTHLLQRTLDHALVPMCAKMGVVLQAYTIATNLKVDEEQSCEL